MLGISDDVELDEDESEDEEAIGTEALQEGSRKRRSSKHHRSRDSFSTDESKSNDLLHEKRKKKKKPYSFIQTFELPSPVTSILVHQNGKRLYCGCQDGAIRLLAPEKNKKKQDIIEGFSSGPKYKQEVLMKSHLSAVTCLATESGFLIR